MTELLRGAWGIASLLAAALLLSAVPAAPSLPAGRNDVVLYVSPYGNDNWSGRVPDASPPATDGPFATVRRAVRAVRELKGRGARGGFTILLRGGTYLFEEPLLLGPEDSGSDSRPFTIKAYPRERPVFSGTREIRAFKPFRDGIYQADLRGTPLGGQPFRQLFSDGKRETLARFPNSSKASGPSGFLYAAGAAQGDSRWRFRYGAGSLPATFELAGSELVIFPGPNYWDNTIPIAALDQGGRIIELAAAASYPVLAGNRFYLQNALAFLDAPGEWYLDLKKEALYFRPGRKGAPRDVAVPVVQSLVQMEGADSVRIEGVTMKGCDGPALRAAGCRGAVIAGCTVFNAGGDGVAIEGGAGNAAIGNEIHGVGGSGIVISGSGCAAENNHVHDVGVFSKGSSGIYCEGTANRVSHNLVHSTPRAGIWFDGNDNVIEYNHVHHVNRETQDSGIIYSCARDWAKRGNIVRFNYLHDSGGYGRNNAREAWRSPFKSWGVYLDDFTSGTEVYGNIIARCNDGALQLHGGRDNLIENNIIIGGGGVGEVVFAAIPASSPHLPGMYAMLKEGDLARYPLLRQIDSPRHGATMSGNAFRRNVVYGKSDSPAFALFGDVDLSSTQVDYNVFYHGGRSPPLEMQQQRLTWEDWLARGMDRHSVVADPLLYEKEPGNIQLSPQSPALRLGFLPIPGKEIGLYRSGARVSGAGRGVLLKKGAGSGD